MTPSEWDALVAEVRKASPRHGMSLAQGCFAGFLDDTVFLVFPQAAAFHRSCVAGAGADVVHRALSAARGRTTRVRILGSTEDACA